MNESQDLHKAIDKSIVITVSTQYVTRKIMLNREIERLEKDYQSKRSLIVNRINRFKDVMPYTYAELMLHFYKAPGYGKKPFNFREYELKYKVDAFIVARMIQKGARFFEESL